MDPILSLVINDNAKISVFFKCLVYGSSLKVEVLEHFFINSVNNNNG